MSAEKVAVVTGSNKGIGYAIVKGLCEKFKGPVYLTSRDVERGKNAVAKLKELGYEPLFYELDITDQDSVDKFKEHIKTTHGGLDLLVNNAGIGSNFGATESFGEQAEKTLAVNYFGTVRVCNALFPLLRKNAKVVNISSAVGFLGRIPSADLRTKFSDPNLTVPQLSKLLEKFVQDAKDGTSQQEEWGNSTYVVSKVGVSALSIVQQRLFDEESPNRNISVNHVHPGYVDTDLSRHKGPLTIEQGAKAPLYVALEANFKGKYVWYDCQVVNWCGKTTPSVY